MAKLEYRSWKLHFAIVSSSMAAATVIAVIRMLIFGFDPSWLLLIPFIPFAVYMTTLSLCLAVCVGGLGFVGFVGWRFLRYLYRRIDHFFNQSETDREFHWSEYFWIAFYLLFFWFLIMLATFIIIGGVHTLMVIGGRST